MGRCQLLLLLLTAIVAVNLTDGKPLERHVFKRESSSHQTVEVPSLIEETAQHPESRIVSPSRNADSQHHHQLEDHLQPTSSLKYSNDQNEVSQLTQHNIKQTIKSTEQSKKRVVGTRKGLKRGRKSNTDLLHHLGMTKLRSPAVNHHRKRLASQSRKTHHQKTSSDSKMFVIKLPPNPYYYAHHDINGFDVVDSQPKSVNNLPVNFKTNGKPSRVYHWNIPVLKKMVARKAGSTGKSAIFADSDIFNIDKQATWNETDDDKAIYRKATYYGPKKQSKHTFRKYFAGNGKPHSFYVMEHSKKPVSVHRLLP